MIRKTDRVHLALILLACVTLGLAPFVPEPHVWEKLRMLFSGQLRRGIDIFDLVLHGSPWVVLGIKLASLWRKRGEPDS